MAEGNGATIDVDPFNVKPGLLDDRQRLRSERFV